VGRRLLRRPLADRPQRRPQLRPRNGVPRLGGARLDARPRPLAM